MQQIVIDFILAVIVISSISILMFRHGILPNHFAKKTTPGPFEDSEKNLAKYDGVKHTGLLNEKDGLLPGFTISYSEAWKQPKVVYRDQDSPSNIVVSDLNHKPQRIPMPADIKFRFTIIDFGNGRVVISDTGLVTVYNREGLKVVVKNGDKQKYPKLNME